MALKAIPDALATNMEARKIAAANGGKLPALLTLDNYRNVQGNTGAFFARQFALCIPAKPKDEKKPASDDDAQIAMPMRPEMLVEKGKDFYSSRSNIIIPASELLLIDTVVKEGVFGRRDFLMLLDPEAITFEKTKTFGNGVFILQNPMAELVENAVTVFGGRGKLDPGTGVALKDEIKALNELPDSEKRWNFILPGIWPITQGIYSYFYYPSQRETQGFRDMNEKHAVLVETIQ